MLRGEIQLLQAMPMFGGVDDSTIEYLIDGAVIRLVERGGCVFREGELDSSIYVIEQGEVSVYRHWKGKDYKLRELGNGDCFGEMAVMDCKPRSATVYADADCRLIQISAAQLGALYGLRPEQYTMIYMNLGREVCRRLREADKRLFLCEIDRSGEPSIA